LSTSRDDDARRRTSVVLACEAKATRTDDAPEFAILEKYTFCT